MTPEEYEEKKNARLSRLEERAERKRREAERLSGEASSMASVIPFGQPILVGHHSEKRDRNYRARIHNKMDKSVQLGREADALEDRVAAAENNSTIYSEDPAAVQKLKEKLAKLEGKQEKMKKVNRLLRKDDDAGLVEMGISEATIARLKEGDYSGRIGFAPYELSNNSANIRRIKKRIEQVRKEQARPTAEKKLDGVTIIDNADESRIQMFFPGKPEAAIRKELKSSGFRWAPSKGCWQAYRNNRSRYQAERIAKILEDV